MQIVTIQLIDFSKEVISFLIYLLADKGNHQCQISLFIFSKKNLLAYCEQEEEVEERLHDRISLEKHFDIRGHSHDLRLESA